jgi:branched-chain amino acid aminotransferase
MTSTKVYINGKLFDKADAKISVFDHGVLYGDGVFEGIRVYDGKVFKLKEHVDRLFESARAIKLEIPMTREQFARAIQDTVAANGKRNGYIRPIVTRGAGTLGLDPRKTSDPQVIIIVDDIALYPPELYESGLEIATVATIRNHPAALNPRIKSLNYLNNILAKIEGIQQGCLESLMLNHKGEISECSGDNIFLVKNGVLYTPPIDAGILKGITRDAVIDLARQAAIRTEQVPLTRHDVFVADECFLTGTAAEIIPVVKCDGRVIGTGKPGPITRQLHEAFHRLTRQ